MPKVSVIVPFYNVENYIEKCLETLVNQTLEEIEIIIVNDGSKDGSKIIAQKFLEKYPEKITYFEKENGGIADARNFGIAHAKGEYIAFLDSDDYVEKDMYENMYELAKKENSDMVECNFYWEYSNKVKEDIKRSYNTENDMLLNARVVVWNKLIKREILEKSNIQFPKGFLYEDVEFIYKLIPFVKKISFVSKCYVHYVQREGSISNTQSERTLEIFDILDHVIKFYKENKYYEKYKQELEYVYIRYAFCSSLLRVLDIENKQLKEQIINKTWENVDNQFPNWKNNEILKKEKTFKNLYLRTINNKTYKIYIKLLSIYVGLKAKIKRKYKTKATF